MKTCLTRFTVGATLFLAILMFSALSASAQGECSPINYRRAFAKANNVFLGEAIEYKDNPSVKDDSLLIVKFKVEKSWKGAKRSEIIIPTTIGWIGESPFIKIGKKYLVYTYGKKMIMPTLCSPSRIYVTGPNLTYQDAQIKQLNSRWFRFRARIIPF